MPKPIEKPADAEEASTTELIEALCELSSETADAPLSGTHIKAIERRLKPEPAE